MTLDATDLSEAIRERVLAVKPGEILAVHVPDGWTPAQAAEFADRCHDWLRVHAPDVRFMLVPPSATVARPAGRIVIEWPAPRVNGMPGWGVSLFDADTGAQIKTAMRLAIDPQDVITAVATVFADEDGNPVYDGNPVAAGDGEGVRTVDVAFIVAGMRIAEEAT